MLALMEICQTYCNQLARSLVTIYNSVQELWKSWEIIGLNFDKAAKIVLLNAGVPLRAGALLHAGVLHQNVQCNEMLSQ